MSCIPEHYSKRSEARAAPSGADMGPEASPAVRSGPSSGQKAAAGFVAGTFGAPLGMTAVAAKEAITSVPKILLGGVKGAQKTYEALTQPARR